MGSSRGWNVLLFLMLAWGVCVLFWRTDVDAPNRAQAREIETREYVSNEERTVVQDAGIFLLERVLYEDFDWPDAVVDIGQSEEELMAAIHELENDPDRVQRVRHRNITESLLRHDWVYRWKQILDLAGLEPTQEFLDRVESLHELAETAGSRVMQTR